MRILLSIDGSAHSDNAINIFLGQQWPPDSEVRIVTVSPDFIALKLGGISTMAATAFQALESDISKMLNETRQRVAEKFGESKVTADFKAQSQRHVAEIIVLDAIGDVYKRQVLSFPGLLLAYAKLFTRNRN